LTQLARVASDGHGAKSILTGQNRSRFHRSVTTGHAARRDDILALGGTTFDGRFQVDRFIAEGGFAVVYKAFQSALDRWVALKVLKSPRGGDDRARSEFRDKFAVEAKTIAKLSHPNIVDVYDFSVATLPDGELAAWMALEWLDGETLAKRLRQRREAGQQGMPPLAAVELLRPALEALAHAHRSGVVHRDVKPANIMVPDDARGVLKVLDFGIAKIVANHDLPTSGHTRTESAPAFSPPYAAPEQVAFSRTGPWTDVHALGLVLSELMTDEPPFKDEGETHVFEQAMSPERPTPARKGRDVGAFEPVLAKALALSPRDRWRNAGELLAAIDDAKAGRTQAIEVATPAGREVVPVRRARRLVIAAVTVGVGLAGGAGFLALRHQTAARPPAPAAPIAATASTRPAPSPPAAITPALLPAAPSPTVTTPEPPPTRRPGHVGKRREAPKAAVASPVNDGRDLFDDTK
jgi:eukaryotic-like serine/threonine-protein kinase